MTSPLTEPVTVLLLVTPSVAPLSTRDESCVSACKVGTDTHTQRHTFETVCFFYFRQYVHAVECGPKYYWPLSAFYFPNISREKRSSTWLKITLSKWCIFNLFTTYCWAFYLLYLWLSSPWNHLVVLQWHPILQGDGVKSEPHKHNHLQTGKSRVEFLSQFIICPH